MIPAPVVKQGRRLVVVAVLGGLGIAPAAADGTFLRRIVGAAVEPVGAAPVAAPGDAALWPEVRVDAGPRGHPVGVGEVPVFED